MTRQASQEELGAHLLGVPLVAPRPPTQGTSLTKMSARTTDKRQGRKKMQSVSQKHSLEVSCVMWVSVFRWTGIVSAITTATMKKRLAIDQYKSL